MKDGAVRDVVTGTLLRERFGRALVALGARLRVPVAAAPASIAVRSTSLGDFAVVLPFLASLRKSCGDRPLDLLTFSRYGDVAESLVPHWPGRRMWIDPVSADGMFSRIRRVRAESGHRHYESVWFAPHNSESWRSVGYKMIAVRAIAGPRARLVGFRRHARIRSREELRVHSDELAFNQALTPFAACGLEPLATRRDVFGLLDLSASEHDAAQRITAHLVPRRLVAMYVHAKDARKRWALDRYATLAQRLLDRDDVALCLVGGPEDRAASVTVTTGLPSARVVVAAGKLNVRQTIALLSRATLFVGNDGAPAHFAALAGVPIVALYCNWEAAGLWEPIVAPRSYALRPSASVRGEGDDYGISAIPLAAVATAVDHMLDQPHDLPRHAIESFALDGSRQMQSHSLSPVLD